MIKRTPPHSLPKDLYRFFWDIKPEQLDPSAKPYYVINRLLDKGDLDAARWVLKCFPKETIIETVKTLRDFSPKSARFWAAYLSVPQEEVLCLQPSYLKTRRTHWPL